MGKSVSAGEPIEMQDNATPHPHETDNDSNPQEIAVDSDHEEIAVDTDLDETTGVTGGSMPFMGPHEVGEPQNLIRQFLFIDLEQEQYCSMCRDFATDLRFCSLCEAGICFTRDEALTGCIVAPSYKDNMFVCPTCKMKKKEPMTVRTSI
jgi:hypothetical protein